MWDRVDRLLCGAAVVACIGAVIFLEWDRPEPERRTGSRAFAGMGVTLPVVWEDGAASCPCCGREVIKEARHCTHCGRFFKWATATCDRCGGSGEVTCPCCGGESGGRCVHCCQGGVAAGCPDCGGDGVLGD